MFVLDEKESSYAPVPALVISTNLPALGYSIHMIGIYRVTNLLNGKSYVGQSRDIKKAWRHHRSSSPNRLVNQAIKECGISNFEFVVLVDLTAEDASDEKLDELHREYVLKLDSFENGYNVTQGGPGNWGRRFSSATKRKMSASQQLRAQDPRVREHLAKASRMRKPTLEYRPEVGQAISDAKKCRVRCVETGIVYPSVQEAARAVGRTFSALSSVLTGVTERCAGYHWVKLDRPNDISSSAHGQLSLGGSD